MNKGFYRRALIGFYITITCSASAAVPRLGQVAAVPFAAAERLVADGQEGKGRRPERLHSDAARLRLDGTETHG